jgi:hypothetical protein
MTDHLNCAATLMFASVFCASAGAADADSQKPVRGATRERGHHAHRYDPVPPQISAWYAKIQERPAFKKMRQVALPSEGIP